MPSPRFLALLPRLAWNRRAAHVGKGPCLTATVLP